MSQNKYERHINFLHEQKEANRLKILYGKFNRIQETETFEND